MTEINAVVVSIVVSDRYCARPLLSWFIADPENPSGAYRMHRSECHLVKQRSLHTCHGKKRFAVDSLREVGIHL
jgi:hypothetical protein